MVSRSNKILSPIDIEDIVTIAIPSVDDPRNILCLVTYFSSDTEQYKLGTRHGLLTKLFQGTTSCRPLFMVCPMPRSIRTLKLASVRQPAYNQ